MIDAQILRPCPITLHVKLRIVQRLGDLRIRSTEDWLHRRNEAFGCFTTRTQRAGRHLNTDRRWHTFVQRHVHNSAGDKQELLERIICGELAAKLANVMGAGVGSSGLFQVDDQVCRVGARVRTEHGREARTLADGQADVGNQRIDFLFRNDRLDSVLNPCDEVFGFIQLCPGQRFDTQLERACIGFGKQFGTDVWQQQKRRTGRNDNDCRPQGRSLQRGIERATIEPARRRRVVTDFSMSIVGKPGYEKKLTTTGFLKSSKMPIVIPRITAAPSTHSAMATAKMAKRFCSEKLVSPMIAYSGWTFWPAVKRLAMTTPTPIVATTTPTTPVANEMIESPPAVVPVAHMTELMVIELEGSDFAMAKDCRWKFYNRCKLWRSLSARICDPWSIIINRSSGCSGRWVGRLAGRKLSIERVKQLGQLFYSSKDELGLANRDRFAAAWEQLATQCADSPVTASRPAMLATVVDDLQMQITP